MLGYFDDDYGSIATRQRHTPRWYGTHMEQDGLVIDARRRKRR
jgi:hypothetical protein